MSDRSSLLGSLQKRLDNGPTNGSRHLLFWHDADAEYAEEVDELAAGLGVGLIKVDRDEYAVKHRLLKEYADTTFIVYRSGGIPAGTQNWLLDLELAYGVFTADRASIIVHDLGLDPALTPLVRKHERFFKSNERIERLRQLLRVDDDALKFRAKLTAVLLRVKDHSLKELTRSILIERASDSSVGFEAVSDHGLAQFFWQGVKNIYGYEPSNPSVDDFIAWVFRSAHDGFVVGSRELPLDYSQWRNDVRSRSAMALLSRRVAEQIGAADSVRDLTYRELIESDAFEVVDRKITDDLAAAIAGGTVTAREVHDVVRARQTTFWFSVEPAFESLYIALKCASELTERLSNASFTITSLDDGLARYASEWSSIDQLYRQFLLHARKAEGNARLDALIDKVEGFYANKFVVPLATEWQKQVDALAAAKATWTASSVAVQRNFFEERVRPAVSQGRRAVVIVSDALRYEVANELASRIRHEDRFSADIEPMLGVVPGFTQLGMASLLPHKSLAFKGVEKSSDVLVDGKPAGGTANRGKILAKVGGTAIQAGDLAAKTVHELRSWLQDYSVVYVFHDVIDGRSHKLGAESGTPGAAEDAIAELVALVKRLSSADASNIVITADHGFLFQESKLDDSSFLPEAPAGDIAFRDRRFLLGGDFVASDAYVTFEPEQLGLESEWQVHIPKSIYRTRLQGAADRFVHGGTTLQEIVVPVVKVSRSAKRDVRPVQVQIRPTSDKITAAIVVLDVYQMEAVSEKVQRLDVTAGVYVGDELLSTTQPLVFDSASEDPRERMQQVRLRLSAEADAHNGKQVEVRLTALAGTSQERSVQAATFTLQRSFATDF